MCVVEERGGDVMNLVLAVFTLLEMSIYIVLTYRHLQLFIVVDKSLGLVCLVIRRVRFLKRIYFSVECRILNFLSEGNKLYASQLVHIQVYNCMLLSSLLRAG